MTLICPLKLMRDYTEDVECEQELCMFYDLENKQCILYTILKKLANYIDKQTPKT